MGITIKSIELIEKAIQLTQPKRVLELGAQHLYDRSYGGEAPYANRWYQKRGLSYTCIDLSGENQSLKIDLEKPVNPDALFDLVTDFGTGEHVRNAYNVFKTLHDYVIPGGVIIRQNPKTGNWPLHGFWYATEAMYIKLAEIQGYEIIDIGEDAAMGNVTDGWNVYCLYKKSGNAPFMSKAKFSSNIKPPIT